MTGRIVPLLAALVATVACQPTGVAQTALTVAADGAGTVGRHGTFRRIQDALDQAGPGSVISVLPGTYRERLHSVRAGHRTAPITIRGVGPRAKIVVTARGNVLSLDHPNVVIENLVLDGQYGRARTVDIRNSASGATLRGIEIRRSGRDCLRVRRTEDVLIEFSLIHRCLNPEGGRRDAHGIVAGAVRRLTIRDTEIHTFSGDAIQLDPARSAPGWNDVVIERCQLWLEPLQASENGFPAGSVPGENAVDTKTWPRGARAALVIRDTTAWGFRDGPIPNMAAFNLKEQVDVDVNGVTVWNSEIAFRVRGAGSRGAGARVTIQNAVIHDVDVAVRHEDNIERIAIWNSTFGTHVERPFVGAQSPPDRPDVQNLLIVAPELPGPAVGPSNLAVSSDVFVDAYHGNYRLQPDGPAVDAGVDLETVTHDRVGRHRPQGERHDLGAYESGPRVVDTPK